jgi:class 3 adenylate cyclase
MNESHSRNHHLAVVMFIDIVRYSGLMYKDEAKALKHVKTLERILKSRVPELKGKLIKFLGDGSMAEFPTALAAVTCSRHVLDEIAQHNAGVGDTEHFEVRIGIHLGEVVEEDGDLFGDTVNIAARVLNLADPGGMALTDAVYGQVKNKISLCGTYLSRIKLKNIPARSQIFITQPPRTFYPLWHLRKHKPSLALVIAVLLILTAMAGSWVAFEPHKPERLALLYIQSQDNDYAMAKAVEEEINHQLSSVNDIEWIDRVGMLDLFNEVGVVNLEAIEELETNACQAARKGGLDYSLIGHLKYQGENLWKLDSKIVCTTTRSVVGTLTNKGSSPQMIVSELKAQLQNWTEENL